MYTYTVSNSNTVEVFVEGQEAPMLRQPHYPNQDAFDTKAEAAEWAQLFIVAMENENAPFAPIGKGIPGGPKPTKAQILEQLKARAEIYGENVPDQFASHIAELEAELNG
jgi:hypothetical protein